MGAPYQSIVGRPHAINKATEKSCCLENYVWTKADWPHRKLTGTENNQLGENTIVGCQGKGRGAPAHGEEGEASATIARAQVTLHETALI